MTGHNTSDDRDGRFRKRRRRRRPIRAATTRRSAEPDDARGCELNRRDPTPERPTRGGTWPHRWMWRCATGFRDDTRLILVAVRTRAAGDELLQFVEFAVAGGVEQILVAQFDSVRLACSVARRPGRDQDIEHFGRAGTQQCRAAILWERRDRGGRRSISPLCESHGSARSGDGLDGGAGSHVNGGKK